MLMLKAKESKEHQINIRKKTRNSGEEYETAKGIEKSKKEFKDFTVH